MLDGVTLLTATGMRPEALELCARFVSRQTHPPSQWVIVDDGEVGSVIDRAILPASMLLTVVRPEPFWKPGQNTLSRNLLVALPEIQNDVIAFFEDDDWYFADYVEAMLKRIGSAEIIGEVPARYYHLPSRKYRVLDNYAHASLCQTVIRSSVIPLLKSICEEPEAAFIDVRLWERFRGSRVLCEARRSVGIKGLPGRAGIGVGHRPELGGDWRLDPDLSTLCEWVGEDAMLYGALGASGTLGGYKPLAQAPPTRPSAPYVSRNRVLDALSGAESAKTSPKPDFTPPEPFPSQPDFEEFFFMGQRRYKCNQVWESGAPCEYDHYDLREILHHIQEPHNRSGKVSERVKRQRESQLVDSRGRNIIVTEEPAPEFDGYKFKEDAQ